MSKTIVVVVALFAILFFGMACNKPDAASVATTVIQSFESTNLSILSQVKWENVLTRLRGTIGPDFRLEVEAYTKSSAGIDFRVRGGTVSIETDAQGTGGAEYNPEIFKELAQVQSRWERADDESRRDTSKWESEVTAAILRAWEKGSAAKNPTSQPEP